MKSLRIALGIAFIAGTMVLNSCDKNASTSGSMYKVKMTDAPGPYTKVNVDIQSVEVTGSNGTTVMLNAHAGVYNLLDFSNGFDTLIAWGQLNIGTVEQVRLILGPNSSLVADGQTYPLTIPSGMESGLKINVHQTLSGAETTLLVDFDANQSIVALGNGGYHMKPVLRGIFTADATASASIVGHISVPGTLAIVTVTGNGQSFSSAVALNGYFRIQGLAAGTYTVVVNPILPFQAVTVSNVTVNAGATADIGLVTL